MADRLIKAEALKKYCVENGEGFVLFLDKLFEMIDEQPTIEAEPVKHGKWIGHFNDLWPSETTQECSVCHKEEYISMFHDNYCPNCGARMDGEK